MKYFTKLYVICFSTGALLAIAGLITASAPIHGNMSGPNIATRSVALILIVALSSLLIHHQLGRPLANLLLVIQQTAKHSKIESLSLSSTRRCKLKQAEATVIHLATTLQQEREARRRAEHEAHHDALTNLANIRGLNTFIDKHFTTNPGAEQKITSAIAFVLDLDLFKQINDTYGHSSGDTVLNIVAGRLQTHIRIDDIAARTGGDEFIILLSCDQPEPRQFSEHIANRISRDVCAPMQVGGNTIDVTTSIGMAIWPHDSPCIQEVLELADQNLYRAKADINRNHQCQPKDQPTLARRLAWS